MWPVSAYDRLFTNYDNLTEAWGAFWAKARRGLKIFGEFFDIGIEIFE